MRRRRIALAAVAIVVGVVTGACGSDDDDVDTTADTTAPTAADTTVVTTGGSADTTGTTGSGGARTVALKAVNFAFNPTQLNLEAGQPVTFVIENGDSVKHNLTVEGMDVDQDVEPGKTAEADATPKKGTYEFTCEYHPAQMQGTFTVL